MKKTIAITLLIVLIMSCCLLGCTPEEEEEEINPGIPASLPNVLGFKSDKNVFDINDVTITVCIGIVDNKGMTDETPITVYIYSREYDGAIMDDYKKEDILNDKSIEIIEVINSPYEGGGGFFSEYSPRKMSFEEEKSYKLFDMNSYDQTSDTSFEYTIAASRFDKTHGKLGVYFSAFYSEDLGKYRRKGKRVLYGSNYLYYIKEGNSILLYTSSSRGEYLENLKERGLVEVRY